MTNTSQSARTPRGVARAAAWLIVISALLWFAGLMDRVVMPLWMLRGVEITVPDLHKLSIQTADSLCSELGLKMVLGRTRLDDQLDSGTVVDQYPLAQARVKPGRRVEVVYTVRSRKVTCPDLMGRSPREAMLIADSLGLTVLPHHIGYWHSSYYPEGVVMNQQPKPTTVPQAGGVLMSRGDTIQLTVSLGPEPTKIVAPPLVGQKLEDVTVLLKKYKLRLGNVTRYPQPSTVPNTVLSQEPSAGTPMEEGDAVDIQVAVKPTN